MNLNFLIFGLLLVGMNEAGVLWDVVTLRSFQMQGLTDN